MQTRIGSANFDRSMARKIGLMLVGLILLCFVVPKYWLAARVLASYLQAPTFLVELWFVFLLSTATTSAVVWWIGRRWKPNGDFELRWWLPRETGKQPRQYTARYMLLVAFWWALASGLTQTCLLTAGTDQSVICYLLSAIAWGGAYGGLFLRMQFGLIAGFVAMLVLSCYLWSATWQYF